MFTEEELKDNYWSDLFSMCSEKYKPLTSKFIKLGHLFCAVGLDGADECWPPTAINQWAQKYCPKEFGTFQFSGKGFSKRYCNENATWAPRTDYSNCTLAQNTLESKSLLNIYFFGYGFSLVALLIGMLILQCFKSLRCVRNQIHTHFMLATFLRGVVWISSVFIVSHHPVS
ncbi:hypothetical protein PHET_01679 [Paragonimus heterotremus]|uniref:G-protein coupled receptors family 2 profile 1 domain-containing protein n=1 Tax=Paragonimus heterotremus TaxID=100268 RepID=A0A8J4SRX8_9TREM|nr:hypothetical protein PHET_01679 [Paragonimus heterotremus]